MSNLNHPEAVQSYKDQGLSSREASLMATLDEKTAQSETVAPEEWKFILEMREKYPAIFAVQKADESSPRRVA